MKKFDRGDGFDRFDLVMVEGDGFEKWKVDVMNLFENIFFFIFI